MGAESSHGFSGTGAGDGSDTGTGADGKLDSERPNATAGAGDEDPAPEERIAEAEGAQGGDPATGRAAAASKLTVSGRHAMRVRGTAARSAHPARSAMATIRAPTGRLVGSGERSTVPAIS